MPNRCDICTIGIGTSMLFFENTWRPFKHYERTVFTFYSNKGRLRVCEECLNDLTNMKNPNEYIKYQSDKIARRLSYKFKDSDNKWN